MTFFKFRKLSDFYQIEEIVNDQIVFFSPLKQLNDDDEILLNSNLAIKNWPVLDDIDSIDKPTPFILSLASGAMKPENKAKMWQEYGDVCICFEYKPSENIRLPFVKVYYLNNKAYKKLKIKKSEQLAGGAIKEASKWKYENELRFISTKSGVLGSPHHHHYLKEIGLSIKKIEYHSSAINSNRFDSLLDLCRVHGLLCTETSQS